MKMPLWNKLFDVLRFCRQPRLCRAAVKPAAIFSDHMVLQCEKPVPVWGVASAGEKVTVSFAGQSKSVNASAAGYWRVTLDPMSASAEPREMQILGSSEIILTDILVGEVWFAGGQSNMEMPVGNNIRPDVYPGVDNFAEEVRNANHPALRLFKVNRQFALRPLDKVPSDGWNVCTPESAEEFSAVAYFFGRYLTQTLKTPVGIIASAASSSRVEQWTSIEALAQLPQFADTVDFYRHAATDRLEQWRIMPEGQPSGLFNGGLAPVIPYAIRGVIWYQGESNADRAFEYRQLLPVMIADWRLRWGQGDFPFYLVQLAGFGSIPQVPGTDNWAELREAQTLTAATVPGTGMTVIMDIGMANIIHPPNKQEVGRRLGLVALALTYSKEIEYSGPVFKNMEISDNRAVLNFDHATGGLVSRNQKQAGKLSFFAIAGKDRVWHWADAVIESDTVVVSSSMVPVPAAVRYAWTPNVVCDFYNQVGLPASPFRTDDWPLSTEGKIYQPGKDFLNAWQEVINQT